MVIKHQKRRRNLLQNVKPGIMGLYDYDLQIAGRFERTIYPRDDSVDIPTDGPFLGEHHGAHWKRPQTEAPYFWYISHGKMHGNNTWKCDTQTVILPS